MDNSGSQSRLPAHLSLKRCSDSLDTVQRCSHLGRRVLLTLKLPRLPLGVACLQGSNLTECMNMDLSNSGDREPLIIPLWETTWDMTGLRATQQKRGWYQQNCPSWSSCTQVQMLLIHIGHGIFQAMHTSVSPQRQMDSFRCGPPAVRQLGSCRSGAELCQV